MIDLQNRSTMENHLLQQMANCQHPYAILRFQEGDYIVVMESPAIYDHSVTFMEASGALIPCVHVQSERYEPFADRGLIEPQDCSPELACLAAIADLYLGTLHEFYPVEQGR